MAKIQQNKKSDQQIKKNKIKMLFVAHSEQLAGAERVLLELMIELIKKDIVCKVIVPAEGLFTTALKQHKIPYTVIPYTWWVSVHHNPEKDLSEKHVYNIKILPLLVQEIQKFKPDIVYSNTMVIPWGAIAAILTDTKHIWGIHEFGLADHNLIFHLDYNFTLKLINALTTHVFANAKAIQKNLESQIDALKISQFYYHIQVDTKKARQKQFELFRNQLATKLIIIGSITPFKGQFEAVKAVHLLHSKNIPIELAVVGPFSNPEYHQLILKYIKKNSLQEIIHIHDFTNNPLGAINQADVLLLCSKNEAFARVVLEGMLLKKPVIGSNSGGTPEQIRDGFNGYLYTPGDTADLASKIEKISKNHKKIKEMGENAFAFVTQNFSYDNYFNAIYNKIKEIYKEPYRTSPERESIKLILSTIMNETLMYITQAVADKLTTHTKLSVANSKLKAENKIVKDKNKRLKTDLDKIQNAKFYMIWQKYASLKKNLTKKEV
jgi:glycosyltransferase involved in cell wall biosynthesis